jgi:hypothetical protein
MVRDPPLRQIALEPLNLHNVGKLGRHALFYDLEAGGLAIPARRCGTLHCLGNLLPSLRDNATGVGEGHVVSMGEQPLRGLRVSFHEFTYRQVVLLDYFVKILYRTHH